MPEVRCKACGSTELTLKGNYWKCDYCGTLMERERSSVAAAAVIDFSNSSKGKNVDRLMERAGMFWDAGSEGQAIRLYKQVLELDPDNKIARERTGC